MGVLLAWGMVAHADPTPEYVAGAIGGLIVGLAVPVLLAIILRARQIRLRGAMTFVAAVCCMLAIATQMDVYAGCGPGDDWNGPHASFSVMHGEYEVVDFDWYSTRHPFPGPCRIRTLSLLGWKIADIHEDWDVPGQPPLNQLLAPSP